MKDETKNILSAFIERARLLQSSNYLNSAKSANFSISYDENNPLLIKSDSPPREELESFVMRFRFFIQDNEPTSLSNISKKLSNDHTCKTLLKEEFESIRSGINLRFNSYPEITVIVNDTNITPTWGNILNTFIYGDIAHTNKEKTKQLDEWKKNCLSLPLFSFYLTKILTHTAYGVITLANMFEKELAAIPSLNPSPQTP